MHKNLSTLKTFTKLATYVQKDIKNTLLQSCNKSVEDDDDIPDISLIGEIPIMNNIPVAMVGAGQRMMLK
jgi:hypothetical protein